MAIQNMSLADEEKQESVSGGAKNTATGLNYVIGRVQRPCQVQSAKAYAAGLSGSPTATLYVERFIAGTGAATFALSGALTQVAFGTSGAQSFSLFAAGSSQNDLQAGDVIRVLTGAANTALTDLFVQVVVKNMGDIKAWS